MNEPQPAEISAVCKMALVRTLSRRIGKSSIDSKSVLVSVKFREWTLDPGRCNTIYKWDCSFSTKGLASLNLWTILARGDDSTPWETNSINHRKECVWKKNPLVYQEQLLNTDKPSKTNADQIESCSFNLICSGSQQEDCPSFCASRCYGCTVAGSSNLVLCYDSEEQTVAGD